MRFAIGAMLPDASKLISNTMAGNECGEMYGIVATGKETSRLVEKVLSSSYGQNAELLERPLICCSCIF